MSPQILTINLTDEQKEALELLVHETGMNTVEELVREIANAQLDRRAYASHGDGHWWSLTVEG